MTNIEYIDKERANISSSTLKIYVDEKFIENSNLFTNEIKYRNKTYYFNGMENNKIYYVGE